MDDPAPSNASSQAASSQEAPAYTLQEAATLLGCSVNTLRRRIDAGIVRAERVSRPQGYVWQVFLDLEQPPTQHAAHPPDQPAGSTLQQPPVASQAAALAAYADQLQRPLLDRLERQAEAIGRLQAENEALRERLAQLEAAKVELAKSAESASFAPTAPPDPPPSRWARFWRRAKHAAVG